jgi:excisionase family DNA binding protein
MTEQTFSTKEAADQLKVSERTVRNMIERGSINAEKLDPQSKSVYRIKATEIQRILGARANKGDQPSRER